MLAHTIHHRLYGSTYYMFIEGLSDWEKRRLALVLKERGHTAFMIVKHANAAVLSRNRGRPVHSVDQKSLEVLDATVKELYGYDRYPDDLRYDEPSRVKITAANDSK